MSKRMNEGEFRAAFYARVDQSGECWLWRGGHFSNGSGAVSREGRMVPAALVMLEYEKPRTAANILLVGPLYATHTCGNSGCVNPGHLEWGKRGRRKQHQPQEI